MTKNYYEILNSTRTDSVQTIKENYQKLILLHHPDKQQTIDDIHSFECSSNGVSSTSNFQSMICQPSSSSDTFVLISEAWNVLRNPVKRKLYDAQNYQNSLDSHSNVFAELDLQDFNLNDPTDIVSSSNDDSDEELKRFYYYTCRCGGNYLIDDLKIFYGNENVTVECDECSLVAIVTNFRGMNGT